MAAGGTVEFRFTVSEDQVRKSNQLKDPLQGTIYGDLFLQEDVSVTGPREGVMRFGGIEVPNVDLVTETTSTASFTSKSLAPGLYVFLGFFDVDGNGATTESPDIGDPVTLALTNTFEITEGGHSKRPIIFELIFN